MVKIHKFGYVFDTDTGNNKKYKVLYNGKYIYFGDKRYAQFHDRISAYSHLDHLDKKRRKLYYQRHENDNFNDPNYAGFWSANYLW